MATDAERFRAFNSERARRARELARIQRDTAADLGDLIRIARERITAQLAGDASDFTRWLNPQLRRSIATVAEQLGEDAGERLAAGAGQAWDAGIDLIDAPINRAAHLDTPGFAIASHLAAVDRRQLEATQRFLTGKMGDVTAEAARRINTEIGQVVLGVQTPAEAVTAVAARLESTRRRGITIVRTELGRAYSAAGQARMAQAQARLSGLRKQWRRSGRLHSRIEHDAADGQVRDVDEAFDVGGDKLMYPRDPAGPPGETINCGCQSLPYMASWEEAGALRDPGRRAFTEEEVAARPERAEINAAVPATVREKVGGGPDAPVVVRSADPGPGHAIRAPSRIERIESMQADAARAAVRREVESGDFLAFASGTPRQGVRAVAMMDAPRRADLGLGAGARVVRLSAETVRTHPRFRSFTAEDWARVQRLVDDGASVAGGARHRLLWRAEEEGPWVVVVKQTADDEVYLVSYRRARVREAKGWVES